MDGLQLIAAAVAVFVVITGLWLLVRRLRRTRHRVTRPELRKRALEHAERLMNLVEEREASRPANDPVIRDHEIPDRRVTFHDDKTQEIYRDKYLRNVAELREHFAEHGIRNAALDDLYDSAENDADLRTISTALAEMASRL